MELGHYGVYQLPKYTTRSEKLFYILTLLALGGLAVKWWSYDSRNPSKCHQQPRLDNRESWGTRPPFLWCLTNENTQPAGLMENTAR
jgi:hypothetical protein